MGKYKERQRLVSPQTDDSLQVPCVNKVKGLNYHHSGSVPCCYYTHLCTSPWLCRWSAVQFHLKLPSFRSPPQLFFALKRLQNVFTRQTLNNKSSTPSLACTCGTDTWGQRQRTPREAALQRSFFSLLRKATSWRLRTKHVIYSFKFSKAWTHDATQNPPQKQDGAFDVARITDPVLLFTIF